jgi:hypothetical protein
MLDTDLADTLPRRKTEHAGRKDEAEQDPADKQRAPRDACRRALALKPAI